MRFTFPCLVIRHVSDRVTVAPLDHPALTTHAPSAEVAREDLALALDDRITRAHPARLADYARPSDCEPFTLAVPALRVWSANGPTGTAPIVFTALRRPAHAGFVEVQLPRLDLRLWVDGAQPLDAQVAPIVASSLDALGDDALLALRSEGAETVETVAVDATPTALSALRRKELRLDERPPPRGLDDAPAEGDDDEDDWDADARKARKAREAKKKRDARPATPTLRAIAVPLHRLAKKDRLDPAFQRDALVKRLADHLALDRPDPLVLVGESGVGKTAAIHEMARAMGRAKNRRMVFAVDASRLIAGDGGFGAWEDQLHRVIDEARKANAILVLGHVVELLDAGRSAHSDHNVAQVLGPVLAAREVAVIGEATPEAWARLQRRDASFAAVWSPLRVEDPSEPDTLAIVERVAEAAAAKLSLRLGPGAVAQCVALVRRFWPYGAVVGNAVTFVRRLLASRAHARAGVATADDATALFSAESGVPLTLLRDDIALDPAAVQAFLSVRVKAQPRAVDRATQVVSVIKAGLSDRRRPVATLFFAGPTGVGKTELAKALAEFLFGARERVVRLDMGEFLGGDAVARLLGDASEAGVLPRAVRRQPFCVVLLDEIEKAHPAVFDALLGVLGEARLTDAAGRTTDFRNAVIVMTSNLGADTLRARVGFGGDPAADAEAARRHYLAEAQRFFRPELFNRLDEVVVFEPLGAEAIRAITQREVERITAREGLRRRDMQLAVADDALDHLAARGLDPRYGARPLKRTLERELVAPTAAWLADHPRAGPSRMEVTVAEGRLATRAVSLPSSAPGSRAEAEAVLDEAADLRALARRWWSSPAAISLRQKVSWFDQASRLASFWKDREVADGAAREANEAREVLGRIESARRGAEASEDLAFEAWWARESQSLDALREELRALRARMDPIGVDLFLASRRRATAGVIYLSAPRGSWERAAYLFNSYFDWAKREELDPVPWVAEYVDPKERPEHPGDELPWAYRWKQRHAYAHESPHPACAAIVLKGSTRCALLEGESGAHRFHDGSQTGFARLRWIPLHASNFEPKVMPVTAAVKVFSEEEIRRYHTGKQSARDLRMRRDFALGESRTRFDPAAVVEAWARHVALGGEEDPWS